MTCALVLTLWRMCQWDHLATIWTSSDPRLWLVCVLLLNLGLLAGGLALLVLIRGDGNELSGPRFLLNYAHVQSLSQLTPGQIGEAMLPYMHASGNVSPGTIAAGLLLQRIVAMFLVAVTAVCLAPSWISTGYIAAQIGGVIFGCIAIAYLIGHEGARARFNTIVGGRYGPILSGFYGSWMQMLRNNRWHRLLPHVCFMIFRFVFVVLTYFVVYISFGISIPLPALTGITAVTILATIVPISLNGLGVTEAIMMLSLQPHGISAEEVFSACVMGRSLWMLVLFSWSCLYWIIGWGDCRRSQSVG